MEFRCPKGHQFFADASKIVTEEDRDETVS
jgi:hypothetical protein